MKALLKMGAFVIIMIAALWVIPQKTSAQNENIDLQVFYDELSAYGSWIESPDYGYVWSPNVEAGFRPYVTNGHWMYTNYGWTWSSDFPWGWAAFHYGRWYMDSQYGYVWVPGTEWGPAWVVWRKAAGYYGWAPMGPGASISLSYGHDYNLPIDNWCFVMDRDFCRIDLGRCFVPRWRYNTIFIHSSLIFNTHYDYRYKHAYVFGPSRYDVQRHYGRMINTYYVNDHDRPGQSLRGNRFSIYRPQFNNRGGYNNSRPANFSRNNDRNNNDRYNYNNNPNRNDKNMNNGSGRGVQNPAVNNSQNGRERENALNNSNSYNYNRGQRQQPNRSNNYQNDRNFNRNDFRLNNNQPGNVVPKQNSTGYQNQRDQNQGRSSNNANIPQWNQSTRNQDNMNNVRTSRPVQIENNSRMINQREARRTEAVQTKSSPQVKPTMVVNPSKNERENKTSETENQPRR